MNLPKASNKTDLNVISALLKISSLVLSKLTLPQIYKNIHLILSEIIYVKNIAILLYDSIEELIIFDYVIDEKGTADLLGKKVPISEGISSYVIRKNKPCLFTAEDIRVLEKQGEISHVIGSIGTSWMGAPITNNEDVMGIIIIQSYSNDNMYDEHELQLLSFVASNLAIVLQQRKFINKEIADKESLKNGLTLIKNQNSALENMMKTLKDTQDELVQKEKMASLGNLVAGIAHEINTPIGICVTAITNLHHQYKTLKNKITNETASDKHLDYFFEDVDETCTIIESNTLRAATLINSFKEIAVDQSSEATREINIKEYIDEILLSMRPILKKSPHNVIVECPDNLIVETIPGAISQILNNMINNSIIHGLNNIEKGYIKITVIKEIGSFTICYQDNGKGLSEEQVKILFEPFYTTQRGSGGSGLGTHVIYNLVTSTLNGKITVQSEPNKGLRYDISIPLSDL